jgi:predicted amidohydrolase YtcJ
VSDTKADLLVRNARVWSDGGSLPAADSIAVRGERVLAVGRAAELEPLAGPRTEIVDAAGATVTPGITDAHIHLVQWSRSLGELSLHGAGSAAAAAERLRGFVTEHPGGGPAIGRGWDSNGWPEPPHRALLDRVAPARPVVLHSHDFHALWVNGAALAAAGVGRGTPDPAGGRIEREPSGEPTGIVRENAVRLFAGLEPDDEGRDRESLRRGVARLHACGVTAVHDFEGPAAQRALRAMSDGGGPRVRVLMHLAHAGLDDALRLGIESGLGDDSFRIGAIKLFADGTLGSRTAALLEPYDGTAERGMELLDPGLLRADVARALHGGLAVAIHAIGDRALRSALDAFEAAGDALRRPRLPSRIEHLQLVDPCDLPRLARLGVAASVQPAHCTSDLELIERWWGSRRDRAYPYRGLVESGALVAFGSDAPVEPPVPSEGLHAAVTRERADGTPRGGFVPRERVPLDAALQCLTAGPARLAGQWPRLGHIAPGTLADLVVWEADLHALDAGALRAARPALTVLDGAIVHRAGRGAAAGRETAALRGALAARGGAGT